jgi:hypothetical protein
MLKVTPHRCHPEKRAVGERAVGKQARKYCLIKITLYEVGECLYSYNTNWTDPLTSATAIAIAIDRARPRGS